jgi:hypothetical protein
MFLFNKKTRNIIKYIWIVLTVFIVLSMVLTYSGFTRLPNTVANQPTEEQIEIPAEVREQFQNQKDGEPVDLEGEGDSYEKQQVLKAIEEGRLNIDPNASGTLTQTPQTDGTAPTTPPAQTLKLEI